MEIVRQINETRHFIIEQIDEGVALCKPVVFDFLKVRLHTNEHICDHHEVLLSCPSLIQHDKFPFHFIQAEVTRRLEIAECFVPASDKKDESNVKIDKES